jgi:hypothetical protein
VDEAIERVEECDDISVFHNIAEFSLQSRSACMRFISLKLHQPTVQTSCNLPVKSLWNISSVCGLYCAGVGKHDAKFAYEHLFRVASRAFANAVCSAVARAPGVASSASTGSGEGGGEAASGAAAGSEVDVAMA